MRPFTYNYRFLNRVRRLYNYKKLKLKEKLQQEKFDRSNTREDQTGLNDLSWMLYGNVDGFYSNVTD